MNQRTLPGRPASPLVVLVILTVLAATGCRKGASDPRESGTVTGKPSDPPVTFAVRWDETNAFVYHFDSITGTPVPRRNSDVLVHQDTIVAQDLRLSVTAITRDDVRSLQLEIQAARVETTSDQNLTSAFDTENLILSTEDNPIANRLRRVKGAKVWYRLSPSNRILRVDGAKEFGDRLGPNRSVRGAAAGVLNKYFSQQFYRDLVEMSFLPTNAVRIGDSWVVSLRSGPGLFNNAATDLTYTFRGWQVREGTNCARFDFTGGTKAAGNTDKKNNNGGSGAEIEGTVWFSPGLGVPVQLIVDQATTRPSVTTGSRVTRTVIQGTNATVRQTGGSPSTPPASSPAADPAAALLAEMEDDGDPAGDTTQPQPGAKTPGTPAASGATVTVSNTPATPPRMITIKQHAVLTLVELVPVEGPKRPN